MAAQPDSHRLDLFGSFLRAHAQIYEALNRDLLAERGISLPWYEVLLQLASAPESKLRLQDLAERVLYSRSGLTRLIDRMESAGLVKRQPCSHDKRGTFASLTPDGSREFRRAAPTHLRGIEEYFFRHLSEPEAEQLGQTMEHLLSARADATDGREAAAAR
jgi:DNA-binding MarR family transcriptional regulator